MISFLEKLNLRILWGLWCGTTLNNFFSAQSTVDDTNATLPPFEPPDTSINEIVISQEDVMDIEIIRYK